MEPKSNYAEANDHVVLAITDMLRVTVTTRDATSLTATDPPKRVVVGERDVKEVLKDGGRDPAGSSTSILIAAEHTTDVSYIATRLTRLRVGCPTTDTVSG